MSLIQSYLVLAVQKREGQYGYVTTVVNEKFQKEVAPQTLCGVREGAAADIATCPLTDFDLDNSLHLRGGRRASNIVLFYQQAFPRLSSRTAGPVE